MSRPRSKSPRRVNTLGSLCQHLRARRGWSQKELAERLNEKFGIKTANKWQANIKTLESTKCDQVAPSMQLDIVMCIFAGLLDTGLEEIYEFFVESLMDSEGSKDSPRSWGELCRMVRKARGWSRQNLTDKVYERFSVDLSNAIKTLENKTTPWSTITVLKLARILATLFSLEESLFFELLACEEQAA